MRVSNVIQKSQLGSDCSKHCRVDPASICQISRDLHADPAYVVNSEQPTGGSNMNSPARDMAAMANNPAICDLRSDTVTRPDEAMRAAMAGAAVGDDVYGDDPTVAALETHAARLLGKQQAAFLPSGTQSNLAAMLAHCGRGDELITGTDYHVKSSEATGASVLGGIAIQTIAIAPDGSLAPDAIRAAVKPNDPHHPVSRLLCLENTHKGRAIPLAAMQAASATARESHLAVHLDGARLFNATLHSVSNRQLWRPPPIPFRCAFQKDLGRRPERC